MSLFKKIAKAEHTAIAEQNLPDESSSHSESDNVPLESLIVDTERRNKFKEHLQSPDDEYWCQACDLYFQLEDDVIAHMQTEEHINIEKEWKIKNPEDIFGTQRYRNNKPSRKELKQQALAQRKKLRKQGLMEPAKTGSGSVKQKSLKKFNQDEYFTQKRLKEKTDTRTQAHVKPKSKKSQKPKE